MIDFSPRQTSRSVRPLRCRNWMRLVSLLMRIHFQEPRSKADRPRNEVRSDRSCASLLPNDLVRAWCVLRANYCSSSSSPLLSERFSRVSSFISLSFSIILSSIILPSFVCLINFLLQDVDCAHNNRRQFHTHETSVLNDRDHFICCKTDDHCIPDVIFSDHDV